MQGKYSPTVSSAYSIDQKWHKNHMSTGCCIYDHDGYDSYGYDRSDVDRAGNHENDYASNNWLYQQTDMEWRFDGIRPTRNTLNVAEDDPVVEMNQIMTITLPDGSTLTGPVTERILTRDNHFFNFEVYSTSGRVTVRVDNKDAYEDLKKRGRI